MKTQKKSPSILRPRPRQENLYKRVAKVNNDGMTKHIKRDQQMRNLKCHA